MKRIPTPLYALAVALVAAPLWGSPLGPEPLPPRLAALSGIDFVPGRSALDELFVGGAAELVELANDELGDGDPGIRLRAYRSLGRFADDPAALAGVREAIARYRNARSGVELLYLIAALDALGELGSGDDVALTVPLLSAVSVDVRAAAARALGGLDATAACAPLRQQTMIAKGLVLVAVDRALRRLGPRCST